MTQSRDDLQRITRLRDLFLDDGRGPLPLEDYWRNDADLKAYDAVLGARIGWKWDAVLTELLARGWQRDDKATVLDYGCGSGIAAQRFAIHCGAGEVLCHDRSGRAMDFAARRVRAAAPGTTSGTLRDIGDLRPDVLLVSHVLAELDEDGEAQLRQLIARSGRVVIVEPGSKLIARRLSSLRDQLRASFRIVAPCTHAEACPALVKNDDWCHFFAAPPPEVFIDSDWVRTGRTLGIDLRSLPYSFLALEQLPEASVPAMETPAEPRARMLGRPTVTPRMATVQICDREGLRSTIVQKRQDPVTWRALKKRPESVRLLPHEGSQDQ